jgi:hypothetical protein
MADSAHYQWETEILSITEKRKHYCRHVEVVARSWTVAKVGHILHRRLLDYLVEREGCRVPRLL